MTVRPEQTRRKMIFGRFMQQLRERCEPRLTPDLLSRQIHTAKTTITRMEGGYTVPGFLLTSTLLGIYGATEEERTRAEQLRQTAKSDTTRIEHVADMPTKYQAFRHDEADAIRERTLDTVVIPGMLQIASYTSALACAASRLSKVDDIQTVNAAERQSRQALLTRSDRPLILHALIDENALRRRIGGTDVTVTQLDHLLTESKRSNITVQVLPLEMGAYAPMSGALVLLDYAADDGPDMAYLERIAGGETVDNADDVAVLSAVWDDVAASAPSPTASAAIIRRMKEEITENG